MLRQKTIISQIHVKFLNYSYFSILNSVQSCFRTYSRRSRHIAMCTRRSRAPDGGCWAPSPPRRTLSCCRGDWTRWTRGGTIWKPRVWLSGQLTRYVIPSTLYYKRGYLPFENYHAWLVRKDSCREIFSYYLMGSEASWCSSGSRIRFILSNMFIMFCKHFSQRLVESDA